jgi:hypothetical protein
MSTNIYDAVRIAIEHRLGEDMRSADILGNIKAHVRRAVFKLQQTNVIPPTQNEYTDADLQTYFNALGEETYSYIELPDDFIELHKLYVNGLVPEWYVSVDGIVAKGISDPTKVFYSTSSVKINGEDKRVLALANVPSGAVITVQYHANVTETLIQSLSERYWEAIIKQVESYLGLPTTQAAILNEQRAKEEAEELASSWRNQTQIIFRTTNRFFGGGRRNGRLIR